MKQICIFLTAMAITICGFTGCNPTSQSSNQADPKPEPQLSGRQILDLMAKSYSSANSYSDKAVLYLTYRTPDGHPMQEPMPWTVTFEKGSQRFNGQFYDSVVKYDGTKLSCQVFEIKSDNLDNQFLLIDSDQLPIDQMLQDPIALHMVGGFSELPLREGSDAILQSFLPPTIQLLSGQVDFPWISKPEKIERLEDQLIEGVVCFHLLTTFKNQPCEMWIEQKTGLIHQILFPHHVFEADQKINLVKDLKIVARFHQCKFNQPVASDDFRIVPPIGASLVTQFVQIPDPFPSELIGKIAPKFELRTPQGEQISHQSLSGKPTVLLWIAGFDSERGIAQLDQIKQRYSDSTNFGVIYSDAEMVDSEGSTFQMNENFVSSLGAYNLQLPFFCDQHLNVWSLLQIKELPSVVIFDQNMRIQYAKPLSGANLPAGVENAIIRVSNGDDLAQEMIDEYGRYHASYQAALRKHEYDIHRQPLTVQNASTQIHGSEKAKDLWTNDALLQPGNLAAIDAGGKVLIAVLDGYRTVVLLDESGQQVRRKQLELPENQAITRIRMANVAGKLVLAAYSKLGSQVHWYDENLELLGKFPQNVSEDIKIEDCEFLVNDSSSQLIVALKDAGIHQVDLATSQSSKLSDNAANDICVSAATLAGVHSGVPFCTALPNLQPSLFRGWYFSGISCNRPNANEKGLFCATVTTENGNWQAMGLDSDFKVQWKLALADLDFQNDIEPLTFSRDHQVWLVADSQRGVSILTRDGQLDYRKRVASDLAGVAVLPSGQRLRFVYSAGNEIKCCEINMGK